MPLCVANEKCWKGCCEWCMAIWVEPNGPCYRTNAHEAAEVPTITTERFSITANQAPADVVAKVLEELVPETVASRLRSSEETFCFSIAAVNREELSDALLKAL